MMRIRRSLFRYHVWLGWLVGVPLLLWTVSGLVMVARPIETVRGTDLKIERTPALLTPNAVPTLPFLAPGGPRVREYRVTVREGRSVAQVKYANEDQARVLRDLAVGHRLSVCQAVVQVDIALARDTELVASWLPALPII